MVNDDVDDNDGDEDDNDGDEDDNDGDEDDEDDEDEVGADTSTPLTSNGTTCPPPSRPRAASIRRHRSANVLRRYDVFRFPRKNAVGRFTISVVAYRVAHAC